MPDSIKDTLGDWFLGILATALLFGFYQAVVLESRVSRLEADIVDPDRIARIESQLKDSRESALRQRAVVSEEILHIRRSMNEAVIPMLNAVTERLFDEIPISGDPGNDPSE